MPPLQRGVQHKLLAVFLVGVVVTMSDGGVEHGIVASVRRAGASCGDSRPFLEIETVSAADGWTAGRILRGRETFAVC